MTFETMVLVLTLLWEAGGEGPDGIRAAASVIWNRAHGDPQKLTAVCLAEKQFSCWNNRSHDAYSVGMAYAMETHHHIPNKQALDVCVWVAKDMLAGTFRPTIRATHYFNPRLLKRPPSWARKLWFVKRIGKHRFYREV